MACLRQLVQREAAEVSDHALSLASASGTDRPTSLVTPAAGNVAATAPRRVGITETGLEGALFGLLDRDTDRQLCSNVQDTLVSLLQALAANNLSRWLVLFKDVLQASSGIYCQSFVYISLIQLQIVSTKLCVLCILAWKSKTLGQISALKVWEGSRLILCRSLNYIFCQSTICAQCNKVKYKRMIKVSENDNCHCAGTNLRKSARNATGSHNGAYSVL